MDVNVGKGLERGSFSEESEQILSQVHVLLFSNVQCSYRQGSARGVARLIVDPGVAAKTSYEEWRQLEHDYRRP